MRRSSLLTYTLREVFHKHTHTHTLSDSYITHPPYIHPLPSKRRTCDSISPLTGCIRGDTRGATHLAEGVVGRNEEL